MLFWLIHKQNSSTPTRNRKTTTRAVAQDHDYDDYNDTESVDDLFHNYDVLNYNQSMNPGKLISSCNPIQAKQVGLVNHFAAAPKMNTVQLVESARADENFLRLIVMIGHSISVTDNVFF